MEKILMKIEKFDEIGNFFIIAHTLFIIFFGMGGGEENLDLYYHDTSFATCLPPWI